jgi:hypothetical protein
MKKKLINALKSFLLVSVVIIISLFVGSLCHNTILLLKTSLLVIGLFLLLISAVIIGL